MDGGSPFYQRLAQRVAESGGMFNAHLHLDRVYALEERYFEGHASVVTDSSISLHEKHHLISNVHAGPAYDREDLERRVNSSLSEMVACNTRRADSLVDVTADRVGVSALETLLSIREERAHEIELNLGAYSPLGFVDDEPQRWEVFLQGAARSQFIAALPEADDTDEYPAHIGFDEHLRRFLVLGQEQKKIVHVHTDQRNEPSEDGTERLVAAVARHGALKSADGSPTVWAVHAISPSTYTEERFDKLTAGLLEHNIGVICCPSAALGMRQLRGLMTPGANSIPRVLEWLAAGVQVRLASDNIADLCSPSTTSNLVHEVFILSAALRYYDVDILAKLACGVALDEAERERVREHLRRDAEEAEKVIASARRRGFG